MVTTPTSLSLSFSPSLPLSPPLPSSCSFFPSSPFLSHSVMRMASVLVSLESPETSAILVKLVLWVLVPMAAEVRTRIEEKYKCIFVIVFIEGIIVSGSFIIGNLYYEDDNSLSKTLITQEVTASRHSLCSTCRVESVIMGWVVLWDTACNLNAIILNQSIFNCLITSASTLLASILCMHICMYILYFCVM